MNENERKPVAKSLRLLRWMIEHGADSVGVREAAAAMGVASSTAHRLLNDLAAEDFIRQDEATGRYALGLEFYRLAQIAVQRTPLKAVALPHMRRLADVCDEAVTLGLYDPAMRKMITIATAESRHPLRYVVEVNTWKPVHIAASGAAIVAFLPPAERDAIIAETRLAPLTPRSITSPKKFNEFLDQVRRDGYAITQGQRILGAVGIAAPLFGPGATVLGCIGITIPEKRYAPRNEARFVSALLQCTSRIIKEIGGSAPARPQAAKAPRALARTARS